MTSYLSSMDALVYLNVIHSQASFATIGPLASLEDILRGSVRGKSRFSHNIRENLRNFLSVKTRDVSCVRESSGRCSTSASVNFAEEKVLQDAPIIVLKCLQVTKC